MPPPGCNVPSDDSHFPTISPGVSAPGSDHSGESCGQNSGFSPLKRPKKTHRELSPEGVRFISNLNDEQGTQERNDAEALWQMMIAPVYGDPICLEEEFSELAVRYAKRGERWIKMAQTTGISATNRRFRSEHRAKIGYGRLKQSERDPHSSPHMAILIKPKPSTRKLCLFLLEITSSVQIL